MKCTVIATTYKDIVSFQPCGNNLVKDLFCSSVTVYKASSIKKWFDEFGMEELEWPT